MHSPLWPTVTNRAESRPSSRSPFKSFPVNLPAIHLKSKNLAASIKYFLDNPPPMAVHSSYGARYFYK